jgi:GT2 family glycosyltransferase
MHQLSVIIVNYNVKYFLEQALLSVQKASIGLDIEVWVVDNNSVDGSVEMVRAKFPSVNVIANEGNVGFSTANNQAIRASNSKYVLLLNPDTVVQEDSFVKCLNYMDNHPEFGGMGVRMIDGKGRFLPESKRGLPTPLVALYKMTGLASLFSKSRKFGKYHLRYLDEFENHEVEVLSGAYMLMRVSCLEKVGLLDEDYFMYGEDIDLSYRILKGGYKNVYFSETTIIHYKGESTKKRSANYVKVFYNAMVLFAQKHYSQRMAGWFSLLIKFAIYVRASLAFVVRLIQQLWLPVLDVLLMVVGFSGIAWYWELYHKFVRGFYPNEYFALHIPIYSLVIMAFAYISGGYDQPVSARRLLRGGVIGAVALFAVYAFLPKELQFSRAILALGSFWSIAALFLARFIASLLGKSEFLQDNSHKRRVVIVGSDVECERIQGLLLRSGVQMEIAGRVHPMESKVVGFMGGVDQLAEIIAVHRVNLVIFSGKDVGSGKIMEVMGAFRDWNGQIKIAPESSETIIGSDSKNEPGELFTVDVKFHLSQPHNRRKKRIMDVLIAVTALLIFPFWGLNQRGRFILKHSVAVLIGVKTWVGYQQVGKKLPILKPHVIEASGKFFGSDFEWDANLSYAKDFEPLLDLERVVAYWRNRY